MLYRRSTTKINLGVPVSKFYAVGRELPKLAPRAGFQKVVLQQQFFQEPVSERSVTALELFSMECVSVPCRNVPGITGSSHEPEEKFRIDQVLFFMVTKPNVVSKTMLQTTELWTKSLQMLVLIVVDLLLYLNITLI